MYIEKMNSVIQVCNEEDLIKMSSYINAITDYTNRRVQDGANASMTLMRVDHMDPEERVAYISRLNAERTRIHETACDAIDSINMMCERYHQPHAFPGYKVEKAPVASLTHDNPARYTSETHNAAAAICAQLCNEFYFEGHYTLEQGLMEEMAKDQAYCKPMTVDEMKKTAAEYGDAHFDTSLEDVLKQATKDEVVVTTHDGSKATLWISNDTTLGICERNQDGDVLTADCKLDLKEYNMLTLGDAMSCVDRQGVGYETPVSIINSCLVLHGGIKEFHEIDRSKEIEVCKDVKSAGKLFKVSMTPDGITLEPRGQEAGELYQAEVNCQDNPTKKGITYYHNETECSLMEFANCMNEDQRHAWSSVIEEYGVKNLPANELEHIQNNDMTK